MVTRPKNKDAGQEAANNVQYGDTILLHFRISSQNGKEIDSTFGSEPIQITLGHQALAENLEKCLIGLPVGERHVFQLEPYQAFGARDAALIQEIPLTEFLPDCLPKENNLINFAMPSGVTLAGTIKSLTPTHAMVDFNHPLSDCPILFEVEVMQILG